MDKSVVATQVIESLRKGIPPQRGTELYTVGHERLIEGIRRHHLNKIDTEGKIRFISGSWGAGKTHFFRLLREVGFQQNCLVSDVELELDSAVLNKFQTVFYAIVRNIVTPSLYTEGGIVEAAPFGRVVRESLTYLATGTHAIEEGIPHEYYAKAREALMSDRSIDIDFKKMIQKYWETFLPEAPDRAVQEQERAEILQWFSGEGTVGYFRKRFGVNKVVSKDNAKLLLQSLAGFVRLSGYKGLLILFDEAEQSYSLMRKSQLRDAHNNLLSLINEDLPGLFLVYATTPDFYTDPKHGIVIYGALVERIGLPEKRSPRALDKVWNLDAVITDLSAYQHAARRIRSIYSDAYPESVAMLPNEQKVDEFVEELLRIHPELSAVRFWRVLVTALVAHFDDHAEGEIRSTTQVHKDVMERLKES